MPRVSPFYSVNEYKKLAANQVHHNNSDCRPGQDIPKEEQKQGTGGYRLCDRCTEINNEGR
jgi:hypothetical protein